MVSRTVKVTSWNARDLHVSARTRATLPLFWSVADAFRREPQGWELSHARFELRRSIEFLGMRWVMSARLGSSIGPPESGTGTRGRLLSLPYVHLWSPPMTRAAVTKAARAGTFNQLTDVFRDHGYAVGWFDVEDRKLAWANPWPHAPGVAPLSTERDWLEHVFQDGRWKRPSRGATRVSGESLWSVLESFRGERGGAWMPADLAFRQSRQLVMDGKPVGEPMLVVQVLRGDQGRNVARSPARAKVGVEFFMRGIAAGDRRRLRRRGWFSRAKRTLEREGFRGEWFRYRNVQPLGRFSRSRLTSAAQVLRERRHLSRIMDELLLVE